MKPPPRSRAVHVARLQAGQGGLIRRILGSPDDVHRLEEFGLRRGVRIEMFRPGNPCILRIAGTKVCVRCDARLTLMVVPEPPLP